nr:ferritin-like protein [Allomuricauda sp.]
MINTREELILALNEAAEIEHSLLIQYLFAAFSLKQSVEEDVTEMQLEEINEWKRTILAIAREEMVHFGSVCNLLSAVGSGPRILRSNFPKRTDYFYGLDAPFILTKFDIETVNRFSIFELPQGMEQQNIMDMPEFAPDPLEYNKVGELYNNILRAFYEIPDVLIGDPKKQDQDGWSLERRKTMEEKILFPIKSLDDVKRAVHNIIEEGEGTPQNPETISDSHYGRFLNIKNRLKKINFEPSRNVVKNPATRIQRDSDHSIDINQIKNNESLLACELFNSIYNSMLISVIQYYSHMGETQNEKTFLKNISWQTMSGIIRPLGEVLTQLPFDKAENDLRSGPSFEIYGEYAIAPSKENRFIVLRERWSDHYRSGLEIKNIHPRMDSIVRKIDWMTKNIEKQIAKE